MQRVYVSLGSNINREQNIIAALDTLDLIFSPLVLSNAYDCKPIGFIGDNFLNLVAGFDTSFSLSKVASILRQIEDDNERTRTGPKFSSRTLDLDILTYGSIVGNIEGVTVPRGEITENAFVLWPLSDVAKNEKHPVLNKSYQTLWDEYDKSSQSLSKVDFNWQSKASD
ncbi:MAG: 2-amino-4-hydroxy-6-hydroxymethyldihydropteridine diphosphokinase [Colwellia sp.]